MIQSFGLVVFNWIRSAAIIRDGGDQIIDGYFRSNQFTIKKGKRDSCWLVFSKNRNE